MPFIEPFQLDQNSPTAQGLVFLGGPGPPGGPFLHDMSGRGNNIIWSGTGNHWVADGERRQVQLFGTDDYGSSDAAIDLSHTDKVSLGFWVKPRVASTGADVFVEFSDNVNNYTDAFMAFFTTGEKIQAFHRGIGGSVTWNTATSLSPGVWSHVIATYDKGLTSSEAKVYLNGALNGAIASDDNTSGNFGNRTLYIGSRAGSSLFFDGRLDDLRLYDRILSLAEIQHIFQLTKVNPYSDIAMQPRRVFKAAAAAGLSIPIAMHHYKQMMGV